MERTRVLLVAGNNLGIGGIQSVIMSIVRSLSDKFRFDIVCLDDAPSYYDREFESFGGSIHRLKRRVSKGRLGQRLGFYVRGRCLYRAIVDVLRHDGPYAALHSHNGLESALALKAARESGVPVRIAHAHTAFPRHYRPALRWYPEFLQGMLLQNATHLVGCSTMACQSLYGLDAPYQVIHNTIDEGFLQAGTGRVAHEQPVLLQVGMICENKNQAFSIEILKELRSVYPEAKLILIGQPKDRTMDAYRADLRVNTKLLGLDEAIEFLPAETEVAMQMQRADCLLLPSRREGFGIVAIEAQAMGLRCIASKGVPRDVDCGGCSFLDLESGAHVWADAIASQFKEAQGIRQHYDMTRFSPDVIMAQYETLYRGNATDYYG